MNHFHLSGIKNYVKVIFGLSLFVTGFNIAGFSQTELEPWGNIISIRVDGQPMGFESSLRVASKDWSNSIHRQGKTKTKIYKKGNQQTVNHGH